MTDLAQAILDDNPLPAVEHANEIFDAETGELLKYRKLITHPKYREAWMTSSANEFGRLAQGVGNTRYRRIGGKTSRTQSLSVN